MTERAILEFSDVVMITIIDNEKSGMAQAFLRWTLENHVHSVLPATTRDGRYTGYFAGSDIDRAREWLQQRNDPSAECPSCGCPSCNDLHCTNNDCKRCTGEDCVVHGEFPCDCDCLDRHYPQGTFS
jgi:hypothetical protein